MVIVINVAAESLQGLIDDWMEVSGFRLVPLEDGTYDLLCRSAPLEMKVLATYA